MVSPHAARNLAIESYKNDFAERFGLQLEIVVTDITPMTTLRQILNLCNSFIPQEIRWVKCISFRNRHTQLVHLRKILTYLAIKNGFTLKQIGNILGNRDHATIIYYRESVRIITNPKYTKGYENFMKYYTPVTEKFEKLYGTPIQNDIVKQPDTKPDVLVVFDSEQFDPITNKCEPGTPDADAGMGEYTISESYGKVNPVLA